MTPPEKKAIPTFEDVAKQWEAVNSPDWKGGTSFTYGSAVNKQLLPIFGALLMTEVTAEKIEVWWTGIRSNGLSKGHLGLIRRLLRDICQRAVSLGIVQTNPTERIMTRLGREGKEVRIGDHLTGEDLNTLLATAEGLTPNQHPIFLVMATAGLRIGEAVALQVGDLDAENRQVHIRRIIQRGRVGSPKNGKGRVVDVPQTTMEVLAKIRDVRQAEAAVDGTEARWLFPGRAPDLPIRAGRVQEAFLKVLRAAGIRKIRPHDLRHTYATLAIQAGVPLLTVSRQLGHASISTTADLYTHAVPGSNRAAAEALEAVLTRNHTHPPRTLEDRPLVFPAS
jgi:integrase